MTIFPFLLMVAYHTMKAARDKKESLQNGGNHAQSKIGRIGGR